MTSRSDEAGDPPQWLHSRLQRLIRVARVSEGEYHRQTLLPELERRLVALIGAYKTALSADLVGFTGLAKAQISHAIKSLEQAGLISRQSLRAPISLTERGDAVFGRIMQVIVSRNRRMVLGLDDAMQRRFHATLLKLTDRAALILAQEQALSERVGELPRHLGIPPSRTVQAGLVDEQGSPLMLPTLNALASFVKRSATLMYKREIGATDFEWQILSQMMDDQPMALAQLIASIGRDKAQVGRAVQKLADIGFVTRQSLGNGREIALQVTDAGYHARRLIYYSELRFDAYLFEQVSPRQRREFLVGLEDIIEKTGRLAP